MSSVRQHTLPMSNFSSIDRIVTLALSSSVLSSGLPAWLPRDIIKLAFQLDNFGNTGPPAKGYTSTACTRSPWPSLSNGYSGAGNGRYFRPSDIGYFSFTNRLRVPSSIIDINPYKKIVYLPTESTRRVLYKSATRCHPKGFRN